MRKVLPAIMLLGILILAAAVRLWGISYGLPCTYCRPDEDRLINTALKLSPPNLNPGYFIWPSLSFYLTRGLLEAIAFIAARGGEAPFHSSREMYRTDPALFHLVLRYLFCGFGVATVFVLYHLGRRMFSVGTGLAAAFLLSLSFLHARDSHFAMLDIPVTLLATVFFLAVWDVYRKGRWADYLRAGFLGGLAVAVKYYAGVLVVSLVLAHLTRSLNSGGKMAGRMFSLRLLVSLVLIMVVLVVTSPYIILDFASFSREIKEGILAPQFMHGFHLLPELTTARGWLYHLTFSLRYGLGWPLEVLCLIGVVYAGWRALRGGAAERLVLSFLVPFYIMLAFQKACFIRYTVMMLPFLCLLGAESLAVLRKWRRLPLLLPVMVLFLAVSDSAYRLVGLDRILNRPDSRNLASAWMEKHIPPDAIVLFPHSLIFGRPPIYSRYYNRIGLTGKESADEVRRLLDSLPAPVFSVIDDHPLLYSRTQPEVKKELTKNAELIFRVEGVGVQGKNARYDPFDAYYVPVAGFEKVTSPGPTISIYLRR